MPETPFDENQTGRSEEGLRQELQRNALEATVRTIEQKIAGLICPDHHARPTLKFSEGAGPGKQNLGFNCCCDKLAKMLQESLGS